jgi:AcrR family transcriptional regulator
MAPRSYALGKREASSAATRQRVRKAALELYIERGITSTTIQAVAERADVARGTVVNHFGTAEQLLEAVLDEVTADLRYPDEHIFEGIHDPAERIRRYVRELFRFFERSESVWPAFSSELELPALKRRELEFYVVLGRLYAAGFGALAGDRIVAASARAFVNYGPLHDLRAAGLSLDEASEVVAEALVALAEGRRTAHTNTEEGVVR